MDDLAVIFMILVVMNWGRSTSSDGAATTCVPVQYAELGRMATIGCSFDKDSYGIYWYGTNDTNSKPFFYLNEGVKSGEGYSSGEFDIHANGSLVINKVTLDHDHIFSVLQLYRKDTIAVTQRVLLVVTVTSSVYPTIQYCDHTRYCFAQLHENYPPACFVNNTRPAIELSWKLRTATNDKVIPFERKTVEADGLTTTLIIIDLSFSINMTYALLICEMKEAPYLKNTEAAMVLLEVNQLRLTHPSSITEHYSNNESIVLRCCDINPVYFVWKMELTGKEYRILAHGSFNNTVIESNDFSLVNGTFLFIERYSSMYQGVYVCIYNTGQVERLNVYNLLPHGLGINKKLGTGFIIFFAIIGLAVIASVSLGVILRRRRSHTDETDCELSNVSTPGTGSIYHQSKSSVNPTLITKNPPGDKLHFVSKLKDSHNKVEHFELGNDCNKVSSKIIIFAGETRMGRTEIINNFVAFILGFSYSGSNKFYFLDNHNDKPDWMYVYNINEHKVNDIRNFKVRIIELPQYGRCQDILSRLEKYFSSNIDDEAHVNAFAFVNVLQETHIEYKDYFLESWGTDSKQLFFDFSDDAFKQENIDTSEGDALIRSNCTEKMWSTFFKMITSSCSINTKEIIEKSIMGCTLAEFVQQLKSKLTSYIDFKTSYHDNLTKYNMEIQRECEFDVTHEETHVEDLKKGEMAIVCKGCRNTCHYPCEKYVINCPVTNFKSKKSGCAVCGGNCEYMKHYRKNYRYVTKKVTKKVTDTDLKQEMMNHPPLYLRESKANLQTARKNVDDQLNLFREYLRSSGLYRKRNIARVKTVIEETMEKERKKKKSGWEDRVQELDNFTSLLEDTG